MDKLLPILAPILVYGYVLLLHLVLPGRWVQGYVTKPWSAEKLLYRLNGIWVLFAVILTSAGACFAGVLPWDWFYTYRWHGLGLPTVSYCVAAMYLSANYFGDLIKKETGKTAQDYIQTKVVEVAKERILDETKSLADVSYSLGF